MITAEKGDRTTGAVLAELIKQGKKVLLPLTYNLRYDLLVDLGNRFCRVQCKTGRLRNGVVIFSPFSVHGKAGKATTKGYEGEADVFGIFCEELEQIYFVPVASGKGAKHLRVLPPKEGGNSKRIKWAKDFQSFDSLTVERGLGKTEV